MATTTKTVIGIPKDGESSATSGSFCKKINDITTAATTYQFAIAKKGSRMVAVVVYT